MGTPRTRPILVATDEGLHRWDDGGTTRVEALSGRAVGALAAGADAWWAIVEGREVWRSPDGTRWAPATAVPPKRTATCLGLMPKRLWVGTAGAHLLCLEGDRLMPVPPFEEVDGRGAWHTPWGAPADVRSISADPDGRVYVNVHVGGVVRSADGGATWRPTLPIDHDVHQVLAPLGHPRLLLVAAFDGFGVSHDEGDTWHWGNAGLHAHYCRAVALAGETVILSASTGPRGRRAAVYRRRLSGDEPFERCRLGLPEWFSGNDATGCLGADGPTVALGTEDGGVFRSSDAGARWEAVVKGLAPVRAVALG